MTRWTKDGKLNLGALGVLELHRWSGGWQWYWSWTPDGHPIDWKEYPSEDAAKRSAVSWLRRALKQAARRLEG